MYSCQQRYFAQDPVGTGHSPISGALKPSAHPHNEPTKYELVYLPSQLAFRALLKWQAVDEVLWLRNNKMTFLIVVLVAHFLVQDVSAISCYNYQIPAGQNPTDTSQGGTSRKNCAQDFQVIFNFNLLID
jgi:hypothetical protein